MKLFHRKPTRARKILFLRKRYLAIPGALLAICALCLVTNLPAYVTASASQRQLPIYSVQRDYKVCALTFDAAWGNEDTQALIDIFDQYNVADSVVFFVTDSAGLLQGCFKIETMLFAIPAMLGNSLFRF